MPCGCHWSRDWWSSVSQASDLGGSGSGQQVPWALSVCTITHFLHKVIYLDTTRQRDTRGLTARVSSYITTHSGRDGLLTCGDFCCQYSQDRNKSGCLRDHNPNETECKKLGKQENTGSSFQWVHPCCWSCQSLLCVMSHDVQTKQRTMGLLTESLS